MLGRRSLAAWEQEMLSDILESDYADLVVLIQARLPSRDGLLSRIERGLARFASNWDGRRRMPNDACDFSAEFELPRSVTRVSLPANDHKAVSDELPEAIAAVKQCEPDIILALDADDAMPKFLTVGKFGVWYQQHGSSGEISGEPGSIVGLREVLGRRPVLKSSLVICRSSIKSGRLAYTTYSNVNPLSYRQTRSEHFWKVSALVPRVMKDIVRNGGRLPLDQPKCEGSLQADVNAGGGLRSILRLLVSTARYVWWRVIVAVQRRLTSEFWVLMINKGEDPFDVKKYSKIEPRKGWFWADPCLVFQNGDHFVFFEEASLETGKGHISVMKLYADGNHSKPEKVLEKPYHLSYPFVFQWQNSFYMIPESAANRTVDLYRCRDFPYDWVFERNLMNGVRAYDATVFEHNGTWWLFANTKDKKGASSWDELSLFYSDDPVKGTWHPHPSNPVVSDVRSARPAGKIFRKDGRIIRPSQNSSYRYGYGIQFNEIIELSKTKYRERVCRSIDPGSSWSIRGTHTFTGNEDMVVIDAYYRVFNGFAPLS